MIRRLVDFALQRRLLVAVLGLALFGWGALAFKRLPVEAYPDVANNWVQVITQWPGRAAEEVEKLVTVPLEMQLNGMPHQTHLRSQSLFGLSVITMIFDDESQNLWNREQVMERLTQVSLPPGLNPTLGPDYSPVGQLMFYTLTSTNPKFDLMELKALQDWEIRKQLKSVPDVIEVTTFGGATREYQVLIDPNKLISYGVSLGQVMQAITANNVNAGGSYIESGQQALNVRAVGLVQTTDDIGATVLKSQGGTPVRVRDVATVTQGPKIKLGQLGKAIHHEDGRVVDRPDVVEGYVILRKGAEAQTMLQRLHEKVAQMNGGGLPPGVKLVPHLDRGDLVEYTTHTVLKNLSEGIALVVVILFFFLGNARSAFIVALTIPFSLLFAAILLDLRKIPANLLSLGALDFGMVVDGAVVMVENILRHVSRDDAEDKRSIFQKLSDASHEVQRPVFYAIVIIITAYVPIFTLQRVEGRLFQPMAWTVAFALLGALVFSLTLAPVLASLFFRKRAREWHNPILGWLTSAYRRALGAALRARLVVGLGAAALLGTSFYLATSDAIGSEFLPHLDEGAIWARGTLATSASPTLAEQVSKKARLAFASFPEVKQVVSQFGRPDDGTDATGFFNTEYFVDLQPREKWRARFQHKEELIAELSNTVEAIPGTLWNFSQPIADNMEEAVSGVKGQLAVKIFGPELKDLEAKAEEIVKVMSQIPGVADLGIFRVMGQPNVNIVVDRAKIDRFGINVSDVQDAIEAAVGGRAVSQVLLGERRFDLVVRYQEPFRRTIQDIAAIRILAPSGERVSLGQLCEIKVEDGAAMIYREGSSRYIAIKYSVRGRDLGSTVEAAMSAVQTHVKLPDERYHLEWAGEYESQKRSQARLLLIVPITIAGIFFILYMAFGSFKWAALQLLNVTVAMSGGFVALLVTGTNFSVSSGVGFLALFGVSVQTGVIMVEYINQLRARGLSIAEATLEGAVRRLRPIMMTMLVATLGLLPAALSHGIGSDSQRPFAIVIVGGLIAGLLVSLFLLPTLYTWFARETDRFREEAATTDDH